MIYTIASLLLIGATATSAAVAPALPTVHNPLSQFMPAKWATLEVSAIQSKKASNDLKAVSPEGYFMAYVYPEANCAVSNNIVMATGTGVCFVGFDQNNTAVGSIEYALDGSGDGFFTISNAVYEGVYDCSGPATTGVFQLPSSCVEDTAGDSAYRYVYTSDPTVWNTFNAGFMAQ
jgi:hypothetical protein